MDHRKIEVYFFLTVFTVVLAVAFFVFLPYLAALVLAATLAVVFYPVHRFVVRKVKGSAGFNAFLTTVFVLVVFLTPIVIFGSQVFVEIAGLYNRVTDGGSVATVPSRLSIYLARYFPDIDPADLIRGFQGLMNQTLDFTVKSVGPVFQSLAGIFEALFVSTVALYYFFKDAEKIERVIYHVLPISQKYSGEVVSKIVIAINSTIRGSLVIAVVQGGLTGIGLFLFAVPNAVLWGLVAVLASLVPVLGTAIIVGPAVIYLVLVGKGVAAIGLLAWGTLIVGLVDNLLRPQLMKKSFDLHPLLILLAVLGGLKLFGPIGFVFGPIILSMAAALFEIYPRLVLDREKSSA